MEKVFTIQNRLGLHARSTAQLVQTVNRFKSDCSIMKDGEWVNGKSIMGVLTLAAAQGAQITVRLEGEDAGAAMEAVEKLINGKFGET